MSEVTPASAPAKQIAEKLTLGLDRLDAAQPFAKANHQPRVYGLALKLAMQPGGVDALYELAPRFEDSGVFDGSDWASPSDLKPDFVSGTLHGGDPHLVALECMSELRMLAIALGDAPHEEVPAADARAFLEAVLAHNLDLVFPDSGETARVRGTATLQAVHEVFRLVAERLGLGGVVESLVDEAERVLEQRPILVHRVAKLIDTAERTLADQGESQVRARADRLYRALHGPTPLSRASETTADYTAAIAKLDAKELREEALAFAATMRATGLVCRDHAPLVRLLSTHGIDALADALALDEVGRSSLRTHHELVQRLIELAVHPATAQSIYGLARLLERGVLYFTPAATGLARLIGLDVRADVAEALRALVGDELPGDAILVSGALQVLGQPLGVGQGDNPTCQSARAISLWSQVDPGYLLEMIARAARDGSIELHFEGDPLLSTDLGPGLAAELHTELDPVSLVLVPHLDRIYAEMSRLVDDRDEDGHKWINPELHGWWVHRGFAAAIGETTGVVTDFNGFVRLFYAAYHPDYNGGRAVVYPQPAGVAVTDLWGQLVGWHAVSIQRVERRPGGELRVYFYNPNNDGRHDWGHGVVTSTYGEGEQPGESSLPFHDYASRTYVFHYNPRELGDPDAVPAGEVDRVTDQARDSWASDMPWNED